MSENSVNEGRSIYIIGGTHAVGTKSLDILLADQNTWALEKLFKLTENEKHWQVLIPVSDIKPRFDPTEQKHFDYANAIDNDWVFEPVNLAPEHVHQEFASSAYSSIFLT